MSQIIIQGLEETFARERSRLVGLCAVLTRNVDAAEDLAQETLFEAWRSIGRLQNPQQLSPWLSGIARNVCLRWERQQKHQLSQLIRPEQTELAALTGEPIEFELERQELIELLDRALGLLSPETRALLVARYVEESPLCEVAARLGIPSGTAAMRVQRGKLALQRSLRNDPASHEYTPPAADAWEETTIWCVSCGQRHLFGQFSSDEGLLLLRCPTCTIYSRSNFSHTGKQHLFSGIKRYKPALSRLRNWIHTFYRASLDLLSAPCLLCGAQTSLRLLSSSDDIVDAEFAADWQGRRGIYHCCPTCQLYNWISLESLTLAHPEGQRFLIAHPRIHLLPEQLLEVDGIPACVTRFASVTDQARFEAVSALDSFRLLRINGKNI